MTPYPWQQHMWQPFVQRITKEKVPHAMLFTGPQGVGKLNFALAFVQHLFCHDVQQGIACGQCKACHLLLINNHPDQYRIARLEDKKNISVEQIRNLISYVNLKPHSSPKKIAIIDQAELMNANASNSLLKTLEEPPESCLLILITHRPDQLLPTIRSRCQFQHFTIPQKALSLAWLKSKMTGEDIEQAEKLLALAGGSPLQAMVYAENKLLSQRDDMFIALQALMENKKHPVEVASLWLKLDMNITLHCITSWLIDMIRLSVNSEPPVLRNPDVKSELLKMSRQCALENMLAFYEFMNTVPKLRQSNINAQLILEEMLVQWSRLNKI